MSTSSRRGNAQEYIFYFRNSPFSNSQKSEQEGVGPFYMSGAIPYDISSLDSQSPNIPINYDICLDTIYLA